MKNPGNKISETNQQINSRLGQSMMLWSEYELSAVNLQKLSDLRVAYGCLKNSNPPYYSEVMYYGNVVAQNALLWLKNHPFLMEDSSKNR
jgi:hypothetical protein